MTRNPKDISLAEGAKKRRGRGDGKPRGTPADLKAARVPPPEETMKAPDWMKRAAERIAEAERAEGELKDRLARREEVTSKGGRPSDFESWMCEAVVDFGKIGMEVVEFAAKLNVARSTLYRWADEHEDFQDALARAREASEAFHAARIREQMAMPSSATNASAYLSYMGRRFKSWREKQEVEHDVGDGLADVLKMIDGKSRTLAPKD